MKLAEIELKDDESRYGGKGFSDETFADFAGDVGAKDIEYCNTVKDFNELLIICGLLPLTKVNYPNAEISDKAINELFEVIEQ